MSEKIIEGNVLEQYKKDYTQYALYTEMHRAVPDAYDGLRPVQRRVVYSAMKNCHATDFIKSANIVGATMQHFHPHGDSSVQGALYTLVNWYQTKMPLFVGRGNFGCTYENAPAAARYTEVKLSPFSLECVLGEIMECNEVVDWIPNYDERCQEPVFLPVKLPLLLVNGSMGICVGDKVDIPSHNINEVIDECIKLIQNPNERVFLIPDHCQQCEIINTDWQDICDKGYGNYKVRGKIEIGQYKGINKKYNGRTTLIIRSCPNLTFLDSIVERIETMISNNKIIGIEDAENQSEIDNLKFVFILRPGIDPNYVREELYKNTALEQTCRVNFKVLEGVTSHRINYTEYIKVFIGFRKITKLRYYEHKLQNIQTRLHVIENYIWAIESGKIDNEVIKLIRSQKTVDDNAMMEKLIKKCNITDIQARFIMELDIKKLSQGYLEKFKEERDRLLPQEKYCIDAVLIPGNIEKIIIQELLDIKAKYGTPRQCKIISKSEAENVPSGDFKITISEGNFIKKIGVNDNITGTRQGDAIKNIIIADNSKNLIIFDNMGRVFKLPISKIPFSDKNSAGVDIRAINKYINCRIASVIYEPILEKFKNGAVITLTKSGYTKKMAIEDFMAVPPSGLVYSKIDNNDSIISVILFGHDADIVVFNNHKALKISTKEIPLLKRNARGNITMSGTDSVEGLSILTKDTKDVLVITSKGYFNKISPDVITTGRNKKGSNVIKLSKNDSLISCLGIDKETIVRCITDTGEVFDIASSNIAQGSSISTGTRLIPAKSGNIIKCNILK